MGRSLLLEASPRGVCRVSESGYLENIREETKIIDTNQGPRASGRILQGSAPVSMNCWGFTPRIFDAIETYWGTFFSKYCLDSSAECFLPSVVGSEIQSERAHVRVLARGEQWLGITYPEEAHLVGSKLLEMHQSGKYPKALTSSSTQ